MNSYNLLNGKTIRIITFLCTLINMPCKVLKKEVEIIYSGGQAGPMSQWEDKRTVGVNSRVLWLFNCPMWVQPTYKEQSSKWMIPSFKYFHPLRLKSLEMKVQVTGHNIISEAPPSSYSNYFLTSRCL